MSEWRRLPATAVRTEGEADLCHSRSAMSAMRRTALDRREPAHPLPHLRRGRPGRGRRHLPAWSGARPSASSGESGCGKSVTALTIMRLIPEPPGRIAGGRIRFKGQDLLDPVRRAEMRHIRGNRISMIFQEPMTSLNPVYTVGDQIAEMFVFHRRMGRKAEPGAGGRHAREGPDPQPGEARRRVSPPAFGRHAAARHDRHGAGLRPGDPHRRRADHRPRRDHPGPDPGPHAQAQAGHRARRSS